LGLAQLTVDEGERCGHVLRGSISPRNPNSRSQTMEMALKLAVPTTLIVTMPGKTDFLKSKPPATLTRLLMT